RKSAQELELWDGWGERIRTSDWLIQSQLTNSSGWAAYRGPPSRRWALGTWVTRALSRDRITPRYNVELGPLVHRRPRNEPRPCSAATRAPTISLSARKSCY